MKSWPRRFLFPAMAASVFLTAFFGAFYLHGQTPKQPPKNDGHSWKTYVNVRFKYSLCYPADLLAPEAESPNSDGRKFAAKDGAALIVYGQNNVLKQSLKDMLDDTASRLAGDSGRVTYKTLKPAWFVVSGQKGDSTFYAKTLFVNLQFKSFELTYPASASAVYNPVAARMAGCFANTQ